MFSRDFFDYITHESKFKLRSGKWDPKTLEVYEQREFLDTLFRILAKLPDWMGKVFMLREMEGCSTEEICSAL
jgi:DNA-directed RNA polymerase specialized sigma24 family protein